jgi:prolyl oligopeptidase
MKHLGNSSAFTKQFAPCLGLSLLLGASAALAQTPGTAATASTAPSAATKVAPEPPDEFAWLEDVMAERSLNWVREQNAVSAALLRGHPSYAPIRERVFSVLSATDKIPYVSRVGGHLHNLWTDEKNKRGLLRRTTLTEYKKPQPAWEMLLDVDALGAAEKENWVYKGMDCLAPSYQRCLMRLSRGGADAVVVREFDLGAKAFVKDGFFVPEAKTSVAWLDANTLIVGTDFGPGSMTKSGYARTLRLLARGASLSNAPEIQAAKESDVGVWITVDDSVSPPRQISTRYINGQTQEVSIRTGSQAWQVLATPADAAVSIQGPWLFVQLRSDWQQRGTSYKSGSLLAGPLADFQRGEGNFQVLYMPTPASSLGNYAVLQQHVIVNVLQDVTSRLVEWSMPQAGKAWAVRDLPNVVSNGRGSISISAWHDAATPNDPLGSAYTINYADFLTPDSYYLAQAGSDARERVKSLPARFDASGMRSEQSFVASKDSTRIPYFVVYPKGAQAAKALPTMLYGYGGFRISQRPFYSGSWGSSWLERGGVVVVANIRGGGEYGPAWHQAARKENRQKSYDDFIAVAEDLVKRGITTPAQLGIYGGSQGGLLVGSVALQRPDLFGAVISAVPLLDMRRYHRLLAGNSWMSEYGDPDKAEEWAYIGAYSPYHNIKPAAQQKYPRWLITTSTRDDRVHPAHARKMVARMKAAGHEVLYFENIEGGHGGAADIAQRADLSALQFAYLWTQLAP